MLVRLSEKVTGLSEKVDRCDLVEYTEESVQFLENHLS